MKISASLDTGYKGLHAEIWLQRQRSGQISAIERHLDTRFEDRRLSFASSVGEPTKLWLVEAAKDLAQAIGTPKEENTFFVPTQP